MPAQNALEAHIKKLIRAHGPITVAHFMELALTHPEYGYYARRDPLGAQGDFTTAPEISQLFGEMVGVCFADYWLKLGAPSSFHLVELGPGRGTLMADILHATQHIPGFHTAMRLHLVEVNETLRTAQRKLLTHPAITWHSHFESILCDAPIFVIANEFFDALPIHQCVYTERGWRERMVALENDSLRFALAPAATPINNLLEESAPIGGVREISPSSLSAINAISKAIATKGGLALIIDYGYTEHAAYRDTLQALKSHRYHPILETIGEADLTAHVDFAALSEAASAHCPVWPVATQGHFLTTLGIRLRAEKLATQASEEQRKALQAALHRLLDPSQMGTLFKVLSFSQKQIAPAYVET